MIFTGITFFFLPPRKVLLDVSFHHQVIFCDSNTQFLDHCPTKNEKVIVNGEPHVLHGGILDGKRAIFH